MLSFSKIISTGLFLFFLTINLVNAQSGGIDFLSSSFDLSGFSSMPEIVMEPAHPQPQKDVKIIINDYKGDFTNYVVEWFENGKKIPNTYNMREITVNSGSSGETKKIKIVYTDTEKLIKKESVVEINPVYIDVILEPQTHVPDFYQGRPLPSSNSIVNVTALVDNTIDEKSLVYVWKINNKSINGFNNGKGLSKTYFTMPNRNSMLTLTVQTRYGKIVGRRVIFVKLAEPELLFYKINSLLGILGNRTLDDNVFIKKSTITIAAEPYFLDSRVYNNPTYLNWVIDGVDTSVSDNPYKITLKDNTENEVSGDKVIERNKVSNVFFRVRGDDRFILQGVEGTVNISL